MILSDKVYDVLKALAQYILPAFSTLIFALASIWNLDVQKIIGTIVSIEACLGGILGVSASKYKSTTYVQGTIIEKVNGRIFLAFVPIEISSTTYDRLKWVVQYVLPGLGTLYFALSSVWSFPYGEEVLGSIAALDAFLGIMLGLSTSEYQEKVHTQQIVAKVSDFDMKADCK